MAALPNRKGVSGWKLTKKMPTQAPVAQAPIRIREKTTAAIDPRNVTLMDSQVSSDPISIDNRKTFANETNGQKVIMSINTNTKRDPYNGQ
jgi:hypothetical protein